MLKIGGREKIPIIRTLYFWGREIRSNWAAIKMLVREKWVTRAAGVTILWTTGKSVW